MGDRTAVRTSPRAAVLLALGLLAAGCGGSAPGGSSTSGKSVDVTLTEYKVSPGQLTLDAGTYSFSANNAGTISHALQLSGNGVDRHTPDFAYSPGRKEGFTATLKPGTYQYFCPVDGHRGLGMVGTLVVH